MDDERQSAKVKMSGYLHLKTKKRMLSTWKNYWFVLEDRLLLFYRSKVEYEAISPCKGSINLGPPCAVKSLPSVTNGFQIETRTVTYTLKAANSDEQKKWLQSILVALKQDPNLAETSKRLTHFRYSLDDLVPKTEPNDPKVTKVSPFGRQNTLPHRIKLEGNKSNEIVRRLQKMGARSYGGSLGTISKIATGKQPSTISSQELRVSKESLPDYGFQRETEAPEGEFLRSRRAIGNNIYERISGDSQSSDRSSLIVENNQYDVTLLRYTSSHEDDDHGKCGDPQTRQTKSLMIENDHYQPNRHVQSDEVIYAEPKIVDCNKNSLIIENSLYAKADVSSCDSSVAPTRENLYEDLDKFSHYTEPVLKNVGEHYSSQSKIKKNKTFVKRFWRKKPKKVEGKPPEEDVYAEIGTPAATKIEMTDETTLQMLSKLHNILETKKSKIEAIASNEDVANLREENLSQETTSTPISEETCPTLPPKTSKIQDAKLNPPNEELRSIDEILEDLDREKIESKSKVQILIEKFSEPETDDVVLRKHEKPVPKNYRHSDDLNQLLDELVKVTSAPVMTPGVTSSLVSPNLPDEEWLKLLPVRQRRLSEPDYDVPRPHKSIQSSAEPDDGDAIPATRFFGPALPPAIIENKQDSAPPSITPDSLEVEAQQKFQTICSYTSHNYNDNTPDLRCFSHNYNPQDDKVIYALPKSYISVATHVVNTCQNIGGATDDCTIVYKNVKNFEVQEEIFKDSLEFSNETSTEF